MSIKVNYNIAATQNSGFSVEQYLHNRGFFETGRRTNAAAWTKSDEDAVIRISNDSIGSFEYFALAQKMAGNPYLPIVHGQTILPSGDHIACVEKLENPSQKHIYTQLKDIRTRIDKGEEVSIVEMDWKQQTENLAIRTKEISDYFMTSTSQLDIDSLPEPSAFREASIAILELAEKIHKEHRLYIPGPDFNPTNILWRRTGAGLQPVLYDPIIRQDDNGRAEREQTNLVRAKFGMNPLEPPRF